MNELKKHRNQVEVHLSDEEVKRLGWSEDKERIIESTTFLLCVLALGLLIYINM